MGFDSRHGTTIDLHQRCIPTLWVQAISQKTESKVSFCPVCRFPMFHVIFISLKNILMSCYKVMDGDCL